MPPGVNDISSGNCTAELFDLFSNGIENTAPIDFLRDEISACSMELTEKKPRLRSLDFFRGLTVAGMILVNNPGDWGHIYAPLEHSAWNGCTPTDLVFPFFLFIVGVSIVYAMGNRKTDQSGHGALILRSAQIDYDLCLVRNIKSDPGF
jgi:hypothetical protein